MSMAIDCRRALRPATVERLENAYADMVDAADYDGRSDRNAVRRYYRACRRASELPYVTCHSVEHSGEFNPAVIMVAFGHAE